MKVWKGVLQTGVVGLLFSVGVLVQEPLMSSLRENPSNILTLLILYGWPAVLASVALGLTPKLDREMGPTRVRVFNALSLLSGLWLFLWCFVWLAMAASFGDRATATVKHLGYLHLFGVGFTFAGYVLAFRFADPLARACQFLTAAGWAVAYVGLVTLYFEPGLSLLWFSVAGGLTLAIASYGLRKAADKT